MHKIVVIGAGVGGLTAAALLAQAGFEVTVLEAHVYSGGCAGTFYHKGYRFDAGATVAGSFQPGGPHALVGEKLGIKWAIERAEPAWVVQLPDRRITRWGWDTHWRAERDEKLPHMRHFWKQQETVADVVWRLAARIPPYPPTTIADLVRLAQTFRPDMLPILPLALTSFSQWLRVNGIRDRASRTFIDGQLLISAQATADRANALYGAIAIDLPRVGTHHVLGGIGGIAAALAGALQKQGGQLFFRQAVTSIVPYKSGYCLTTNKGLELYADAVIANMTPWGLRKVLGEHTPAALLHETQQRPETWGAFTVYAGVDAHAVQGESDHYQIIMNYDQPLGEGNSVFLSLSHPNDTDRAPTGQRTLTMSSHTRLADWWDLQQRDPDAYYARREEYQERFLRAAEQIFPHLRSGIRFIMNGTPQTFQKFTRRPRGMVGGFPQTSLLAARGPQTGLPNLWLVGDSIFPGQSTAGVTMGGMRVAADVQRAFSTKHGKSL